jgi:hypothetical protein
MSKPTFLKGPQGEDAQLPKTIDKLSERFPRREGADFHKRAATQEQCILVKVSQNANTIFVQKALDLAPD